VKLWKPTGKHKESSGGGFPCIWGAFRWLSTGFQCIWGAFMGFQCIWRTLQPPETPGNRLGTPWESYQYTWEASRELSAPLGTSWGAFKELSAHLEGFQGAFSTSGGLSGPSASSGAL